MVKEIKYRPEFAEKLEKVTDVVTRLLEIDPRVVESSLAKFYVAHNKDCASVDDIGEMLRIFKCHPEELITENNSGLKTATCKYAKEALKSTYSESALRLYSVIKKITEEYKEELIVGLKEPLTPYEENLVEKVFSNFRLWLDWPGFRPSMSGKSYCDEHLRETADMFRSWSKNTRGEARRIAALFKDHGDLDEEREM